MTRARGKKTKAAARIDVSLLKQVVGVNCEGDVEPAVLYDPVARCVVKADPNSYHGPTVEVVPFAEIIEKALDGGTHKDSVHKFMMDVPEYCEMFDQAVAGVEPVFKEKDQAWRMVGASRVSDQRARFYTAGKALGYQKERNYCSGTTTPKELEKSRKVEVVRDFIDNMDGRVDEGVEGGFHAIESYADHEAMLEAARAMKKALGERKIKGGQIIWGGRVFCF